MAGFAGSGMEYEAKMDLQIEFFKNRSWLWIDLNEALER